MGCNDYYDPVREREQNNFTRNIKIINLSTCARFTGLVANDYVGCLACGAMIFTGDLFREPDLPWVRIHYRWHNSPGVDGANHDTTHPQEKAEQ